MDDAEIEGILARLAERERAASRQRCTAGLRYRAPLLDGSVPAVADGPRVAVAMAWQQDEGDYGWITWTLTLGGEVLTFFLSNVYPPFEDLWLLNLHIARGALPCGIHVDTGPKTFHLHALPAPAAPGDFTLVIAEEWSDAPPRVFTVGRQAWLAAFAGTLGAFLAAGYREDDWIADALSGRGHPEFLDWQAVATARPAGAGESGRARARILLEAAGHCLSHRSGPIPGDLDTMALHHVEGIGRALALAVLAWQADRKMLPDVPRLDLEPWREMPATLVDAIAEAWWQAECFVERVVDASTAPGDREASLLNEARAATDRVLRAVAAALA